MVYEKPQNGARNVTPENVASGQAIIALYLKALSGISSSFFGVGLSDDSGVEVKYAQMDNDGNSSLTVVL